MPTYLAEPHTHTNCVQHAYSTPVEMILAAKRAGIGLIAFTEHGPALPDGAHPWRFENMRAIPHKAEGIYVLRGAEANIIDLEGGLDMDGALISLLDLVIASIHKPLLAPGTREEHTRLYVNVLRNPHVDIIGHCGYPEYEFDLDTVLLEAKRQNKVIEINSHTFDVRKASAENCRKIAKRCGELGVKIAVTTDAHSIYELGKTQHAEEAVRSAGVPEELVVNTTPERFLSWLCERRGFDRQRFEDTRPGR